MAPSMVKATLIVAKYGMAISAKMAKAVGGMASAYGVSEASASVANEIMLLRAACQHQNKLMQEMWRISNKLAESVANEK